MRDLDASRLALERLFGRRPVADVSQLARALGTDSRMSIFRRLSVVGYRSNYTHSGRYYTLASRLEFDSDGLWRYEGIGFSRDGTLRSTVKRLVETSDAGRTQHELQQRLCVRVHNPLLDLVEDKQLRRESIEDEYVYVAARRARAKVQLGLRRSRTVAEGAPAPPAPALEIDVLLEVIHGARVPPPNAASVTARLGARGICASLGEVAAVLARHGLEKKTAPSRLVRSRR